MYDMVLVQICQCELSGGELSVLVLVRVGSGEWYES